MQENGLDFAIWKRKIIYATIRIVISRYFMSQYPLLFVDSLHKQKRLYNYHNKET